MAKRTKKKKTATGRKRTVRAATGHTRGAEDDPNESTADRQQEVGERFARTFAPPELYDEGKRKKWGVEAEPGARGPYVIELNLQHIQGLYGATTALLALHSEVRELQDTQPPRRISKTYYAWHLSVEEWKALLAEDERRATDAAGNSPNQVDSMRHRAIYKLWPDFRVRGQIYRSLSTIKANAAHRSFEAEGRGIVWAVIDSGIDRRHGHFAAHETLEGPDVRDLHRAFVPSTDSEGREVETPPPDDPDDPTLAHDDPKRKARLKAHVSEALKDVFGHGTHVAGIIAGAAPTGNAGKNVRLLERVDQIGPDGELVRGGANVTRAPDPSRLRGVAPLCKLVSLKVLDAEGDGRSSDVIRALEYIREKLNDNPKLLRVHGVNLSVGYEFDAEMFACGQSPICAEVNRLVQSGVVVVAAAGNTGYGTVASSTRNTKVALSNTINDPGNAEFAITVGATHRDSPYMFGVSYFSSKGPTGDGRLKPDLVAPGERITSCGTGTRLTDALDSGKEEGKLVYYTEDSGTSMAAPHVSGAAAAFLSIQREFIGKPLDVKKIFMKTASPLGRERYFEGHGLVDLVRAIQSV